MAVGVEKGNVEAAAALHQNVERMSGSVDHRRAGRSHSVAAKEEMTGEMRGGERRGLGREEDEKGKGEEGRERREGQE